MGDLPGGESAPGSGVHPGYIRMYSRQGQPGSHAAAEILAEYGFQEGRGNLVFPKAGYKQIFLSGIAPDTERNPGQENQG